jgi:DNA-binding response OmpR family regulator
MSFALHLTRQQQSALAALPRSGHIVLCPAAGGVYHGPILVRRPGEPPIVLAPNGAVRPTDEQPTLLTAGSLEIDVRSRQVRVGGRSLELPPMQYRLLEKLASEPTRLWSRAELLREVWGFRSPPRTRTVDVHVARLRRTLTGLGFDGPLTLRGHGFRLTRDACGAPGAPLASVA